MASDLKKRVRDLKISSKKRRDVDPEDDPFAGNSDSPGSNSDSEDNVATGREHYEAVGKSKLRRPERIELDSKKYGGAVVSRAALNDDGPDEDDDEDDPFAPVEDEDDDPFAAPSDIQSDEEGVQLDSDGKDGADEDDEIDSDEAFEDGDEEKFRGKGFVFRGSGMSHRVATGTISDDEVDNVNSSDDVTQESDSDSASNPDVDMEDSEGLQNDSDDDDMGDEDDDEEDEDEDEEEDEMSARPKLTALSQHSGTKRKQLKSIMSDTAAITSSLSQAASVDAKKGTAVRRQYQTYDRFVDARIKLQKGLSSCNELSSLGVVSDTEAQDAVQKAEEAALALFSTIESIRRTILESHQDSTNSAKTSPKRKRPTAVSPTTTETEILDRISDFENELDSRRRTVLDKWANKTRSTTQQMTSANSSKLRSSTNTTDPQSNLSSVIDAYLQSSLDKLVTESKTNLATDPSTSNNTSASSLPPFQDTIFYQSLLRDIINTRANLTSSSQPATNSTNTTILPTKLHPSGSQSALLRNKQINRKASKGRKVRYTVHEKLENFMTGTGTSTSAGSGAGMGQWSDAAVREFFGSLLGRGSVLVEDDGDGDENGFDDGDGEDDQMEVEALRLFRS